MVATPLKVHEYDSTLAADGLADSPPLLLLHAYPVDHRLWDDVGGALERHPSRATRVIAVDLPGLGGSAVPDEEPSLDVSARLVAETLDALGIDEVVLAGVSLGGYVALAFAQAYPERVGALVLIDTKSTADDDAAREARLRWAREVEAAGTTEPLRPTLAGLLGATTQEAGSEVSDRVWSMITDQSSAGVAWTQRAMAARPDRTEVVASLDVPIRIVMGAEDQLISFHDVDQLVLAAKHNSTEYIAGAGHLTPIESPREIAAALRAACLGVADLRERNSRA